MDHSTTTPRLAPLGTGTLHAPASSNVTSRDLRGVATISRMQRPLVALLLLLGSACGTQGSGLSSDDPDLSGQAVSAISWSSFKPAAFKSGDDVTIPVGTSVVFDGDAADAIGKLTVLGSFTCAPGARTLEAKAILVSGAGASFNCGAAAAPRVEQFKIHLSGQTAFSHDEMMTICPSMPAGSMPMTGSGNQAFLVMCGATINLKGATSGALWTRLSATAAVSAKQITLPGVDCATWTAGSNIVIASSSFDHNQAETMPIAACATAAGVTTLTFTSALKYQHWGAPTATYAAGSTTLPLVDQAEVALLTRPILFQGTELTDAASKLAQQDKKGAHMMFMSAPGNVRIDGVEFETVGRMGEIGRYPAHWHKDGDHLGAGNVAYDAYIKNSSIHHSFNRCVTIHETNGVTVSNNVCYDHYGHGFFLEEGNETNNTFDSNLGLGSKAVPLGRQILTTDRTSDNVGRYAAPATFWISNPANTYTNNVAAGSDGSGFWFALKDQAHAPDNTPVDSAGTPIAPVKTALTLFDKNVAHSSRQGVTMDGGPNGACAGNPLNDCNDTATFDIDTADFLTKQTVYTPSSVATIRRLTAYKCREFGIWFNSLGNNVVKESIFADNQIGVAIVFDGVLRDSVVVAQTANFDAQAEIPKTTRALGAKQFAATLVYDGPSFLDNVHLEGFPSSMTYTDSTTAPATTYTYQPKVFSMTVAAADRSPVHRVRALSFGAVTGTATVLADFDHDLGHYSKDNWSAGVWDMDGSLTGHADFTLVPAESISSVTGCLTDSRFANALLCPGRFGQIFLASGNLQFDVIRTDTATGATLAQFLLPSAPNPVHPDLVPGAPYVDHQLSFSRSRAALETYSVRIHAPTQVATSDADPTLLTTSDLSKAMSMRLSWVDNGETSPPFEIYQMGHNCKILNPATLGGVNVSQADADVVKLQFTATTLSPKGWPAGTFGGTAYAGQKYQSVPVWLQCYVPSSVSMLSPTLQKDGAWYFQNGELVGTSNGAKGPAHFEANVSGTQVKLVASIGPNRGYASVTVDSLAPVLVDMYASKYTAQTLQIASGLAGGPHKVVIDYTGTHNPLSTGNYLVLDSVSAL